MVPSEFMENASFAPLFYGSVQKNPENIFSIKTWNITHQTLQIRTIIIKLELPQPIHICICICNQLGASREHQKMFRANTTDFYQIFLHIKQIIRPS